MLTANPPYVAESDELGDDVRHEPGVALYAGSDGLDVIRKLLAQAPGMIVPGGLLAMEFSFSQADAVRELIVAGDFDEPRILRDHQGIERIALARRKS